MHALLIDLSLLTLVEETSARAVDGPIAVDVCRGNECRADDLTKAVV